MGEKIDHSENCCPRDAEILERVDQAATQVLALLQTVNMEDIKKSMLGKMLGIK